MLATDNVVISVDLVDKAMRSEDVPHEFKNEERLRDAEQRYRKFLQLIMRRPDAPVAPTRDIDLMWHLHMLSPRAYAADCAAMFGEILDHDGGFGATEDEAPDLERLFEATAQLWREEFGEDYTASPNAAMTKCTRNCVSRCKRACKT